MLDCLGNVEFRHTVCCKYENTYTRKKIKKAREKLRYRRAIQLPIFTIESVHKKKKKKKIRPKDKDTNNR